MKTRQYSKHFITNILSTGCLILLINACTTSLPKETSTEYPDIFPDYKDVIVPCNIAPVNFMIENAHKISADFYTREQIGEMLKTETFSSRSQTVAWFFKNGCLPGRGEVGEA